MDVMDMIMDFEDGSLSEDKTLELFQYLGLLGSFKALMAGLPKG